MRSLWQRLNTFQRFALFRRFLLSIHHYSIEDHHELHRTYCDHHCHSMVHHRSSRHLIHRRNPNTSDDVASSAMTPLKVGAIRYSDILCLGAYTNSIISTSDLN
ncbi:hypothetical protein AAHE18_07G013900 [Arachis hypogaea]